MVLGKSYKLHQPNTLEYSSTLIGGGGAARQKRGDAVRAKVVRKKWRRLPLRCLRPAAWTRSNPLRFRCLDAIHWSASLSLLSWLSVFLGARSPLESSRSIA